MTLAVFFGCTFIAFGPALGLFLFTIARDPLRIIILIAGSPVTRQLPSRCARPGGCLCFPSPGMSFGALGLYQRGSSDFPWANSSGSPGLWGWSSSALAFFLCILSSAQALRQHFLGN
uniref:Gamma-secretase subunit APH-1 n=1 Tax=Nothoprocta perdicaria TaxID=30464 RepID=A0A8C6ZBJ9_NOTPE